MTRDILDTLPDETADKLAEIHDHRHEIARTNITPADLLDEILEDALETMRRSRRIHDARQRVIDSQPTDAIRRLYGATDEVIDTWFNEHTSEMGSVLERDGFAIGTDSKDDQYFRKQRRKAVYGLGSIQIFAETCEPLLDRSVPEVAVIGDNASEGVILPFTLPHPQQAHAFEIELRFLEDRMAKSTTSEQLDACRENGYSDEMDDQTWLIAVADTPRLPVRTSETTVTETTIHRPDWMADLREIVHEAPGTAHTAEPFEQRGDWNPFEPREARS